MTLKSFICKVHNRWKKLRLQPIRVFCIHHVTDDFDADSMWPCDWIQTDVFKESITELQKQYTFISLLEAQEHLHKDWFRRKKYAVMTADDGFASMKQVVPWLVERRIPITLFINPVVWDGKTIGQNLQSLPIAKKKNGAKGLYLLLDDLNGLQSPLVTFGYHGYEHIDESKETYDVFVGNFEKCRTLMSQLDNVIPFYAHTNGLATKGNDMFLESINITPVFVNGVVNYNQESYIDRELLTSKTIDT